MLENKKEVIDMVFFEYDAEAEKGSPSWTALSDCRQNAFGQHSRSVFLVLGSKSVYLINNKHFWVPLFPFLAIIFAS
ncbi:MAG: hypothetical protein U0M75_11045, partial [Lachnospiraceae bacterium]